MIAPNGEKLSARCPAATIFDPPIGHAGVICGVLARDAREDADPVQESGDWHVFTVDENPATVLGYCCREYQKCRIWREDKRREEERRKLLKPPEEKGPTSYEKLLSEAF